MTITIKLPLRRQCHNKKQYGGTWNWCKMVQNWTGAKQNACWPTSQVDLLEEGRCGIPLTSQSCVVKPTLSCVLLLLVRTSWLIFSYLLSMYSLNNGHCLTWLLIVLLALNNNSLVCHVVVGRHRPDRTRTLHKVLHLGKSLFCRSLFLCIELVNQLSRLLQMWSLNLIIWY